MNGKIQNSVGFTATAGTVRNLTIREQLLRVINTGITTINHPVHGTIEVTKGHAIALVDTYQEGHLLRFKASLFQG